MSAVSFLLKKPAKTTGLSLIYLQFKYKGNRLLASTGHSIIPSQWNKDRQCVKNNQATTNDGQHYINDLLSNLSNIVLSAFRKESSTGIPTPGQLKKYLDEFFSSNIEKEKIEKEKATLYQLIDRFIKNEILYKGRQKSIGTIKSYITTLKHLKTFEKKENYLIDFETITLDFFYKWMAYLKDCGVEANTQNKYLGCLKAFMSEGHEMGLHESLDFRKKRFSVGQVLSETVYLKEEEISQLYNCDLSNMPKLENVRDAFVIACYTGLRFGDFSTLKTEHFQEIEGEMFIKKVTSKTKEEVIIPLNKTIIEIIDKYKNSKFLLPRVPCNQIFNRQVKIVCEKAGLIEKGRLANSPDTPLFLSISSHSARRTFATNAYLAGVPTLDIMRLTSHKSEKNFLRYVRLGRLHAAQRFSQHISMNKGKALMRIA